LAGRIYGLLPERINKEIMSYIPNGGQFRFAPDGSKYNPISTIDRNKKICQKRNEGLKIKELTEFFHLSKRTIRRILKENGLPTSDEKQQNKIYEVIAMLKTDYNVTQIKKKTGYSRAWIYEIKRREGL